MFGVAINIFTPMGIGPHLPEPANAGLKGIGNTEEVDGFGYPAIGKDKKYTIIFNRVIENNNRVIESKLKPAFVQACLLYKHSFVKVLLWHNVSSNNYVSN